MRDFQRSKVYAWEHVVFRNCYNEDLPLDRCREIAARLYGARVKVTDGRGRRRACAYDLRYPTIALPRWARCQWVIAHEVAHLVHRADDIPAHGGTWMRTYLDLLSLLGYDSQALENNAREYGLRVLPRPG